MNKHRRVDAWIACKDLAVAICRVTSTFPRHERYEITSQLRRSAVSAAANIAEGLARFGNREGAHGVSIGLGSLAEVDTLIAIVGELEYVTPAQLQQLDKLRDRASALTFALQRSLRAAAARETR